MYLGDEISEFEQLIGWIVLNAFYDGDSIYLCTYKGVVKLSPHGDCCATCYVQHVAGADALRNSVVTRIEHITMPTLVDHEYNDVSDLWGHVIYTDKGTCSIEMRVDHNGYYGGELRIGRCADPMGKILDDF